MLGHMLLHMDLKPSSGRSARELRSYYEQGTFAVLNATHSFCCAIEPGVGDIEDSPSMEVMRDADDDGRMPPTLSARECAGLKELQNHLAYTQAPDYAGFTSGSGGHHAMYYTSVTTMLAQLCDARGAAAS